MKRSLRFALCIATVVFLNAVPAELLAHHSGDPKLDRAVEKANSEFIVAMKTGDAATIAAPYRGRVFHNDRWRLRSGPHGN